MSQLSLEWDETASYFNDGPGLVAVGVDADLFDKVAEKLAMSGDLEKACFWSMVDFINAFRSFQLNIILFEDFLLVSSQKNPIPKEFSSIFGTILT